MASSAVLSTLKHVTDMKSSQLARQWNAFEAAKRNTLTQVDDKTDELEKVRLLLKRAAGKYASDSERAVNRKNIEKFLDQAKYDASISTSTLKDWQTTLKTELNCQSEKYKFTSLFGRLVTEWITNPNDESMEPQRESENDSDSSSDNSSFESLGREEMYQQRKEWESYAFKERVVDETALHKYLDDLFTSTFKSRKSNKTPIEALRERMTKFDERGLVTMNGERVRFAINSLLKMDLFAGEKRKALIDLRDQTAVRNELGDVLNADIEALDKWEWGSAVHIKMRKQINGKYRFFLDEELHTAILLQWIGISWATYFKKSFVGFFNSGAWIQRPHLSITKKDRQRRKQFLGSDIGSSEKSIREKRREQFLSTYFLTQLPEGVQSHPRCDYGQHDDEIAATGGDADAKKFLSIKQSLLSLVTTESLVHNHLYGKFCVLQSDFKWFGPSLPHASILAVLRYFHVPEKWLDFFQRFLQTPVVFSQDGSNADTRTRRCGVPMSHMLADAMGEALLFVLDFAVNQATRGSNLYRFHDDLWFWGQPDTCVKAWKSITTFTQIMGLALNEEKTGTCLIVKPSSSHTLLPKGLPNGIVRWGFLKLDSSSGRWLADNEDIDKHVTEMKRQLSTCRSVFAYVQAYNAYMSRFFVNNLGSPTLGLGRDHLEMVINTVQRIQTLLHSDTNLSVSSVSAHLRNVISERFHVDNIPDGFIHFPTSFGGLGVRNPFVSLLSRRRFARDPQDIVQIGYEKEEDEYESYKAKYNAGDVAESKTGDEPFMSKEEFMRFREERSSIFLDQVYMELLKEMPEETMEQTPAMETALPSYISFPHKKWLLEMYGRDIIKRFGSLYITESDLSPIGLIDMLKDERVRWRG